MLGRSLLEFYALRETVLGALATASLPMLLLALAIAAFFARRTSRRLARIHETIARIMQGDLHVRLPVRKRPDDMDRVARDVNRMLDEIVRLLIQIKGVGDDIAHDLRAPLSVMRAKLERGVAGQDDRELRLVANQALVELDKAMVTITALLRIAEIENGPRSSEFKPMDLAAICGDAFEFFEPLARAKSILMTLDAKAPVPIVGDADLMREALLNLVDNAVKFTPAGGKVAISATLEAGRPTVRVRDSGSGVEPGEREKIFERFHRTAHHSHAAGSGLGLSIAAAIASLHKFDLKVKDNKPGALFEMGARAERRCPPVRLPAPGPGSDLAAVCAGSFLGGQQSAASPGNSQRQPPLETAQPLLHSSASREKTIAVLKIARRAGSPLLIRRTDIGRPSCDHRRSRLRPRRRRRNRNVHDGVGGP